VVVAVVEGRLRASASSALYDDVITALRSKDYPLSEAKAAIRGIAAIPHISLPVTPEIALAALELYERHGGSRRLHYFDSFHVATAALHRLPLITSDKYIIANEGALGIRALDLRKLRSKK
jgi:predicted nucleic acid-binding protein